MKHKHILPILLMGALGLQSCSDFLDTKPTEGYPETTVWETQGTVDAFVIGNYGNAFGLTNGSLHGTRHSPTTW